MHLMQLRNFGALSPPPCTLKESNIYSNKGVLWALLSVPV